MGLNLSVALGIAVAQPDKSVIVMEGDGGLMMKMESLITVGAKAPPNLLVITFNNKFYVTGGGQPLPTDKIDLESFAQAALFPQTATVDSPDAFDAVLDRMLDSGKLGYINLLVARDPEKDLPGSKKDLLQGDGIPRPEEMRTDLVRWIRENCP
jgi:phosphonopyruvate decarboxylase